MNRVNTYRSKFILSLVILITIILVAWLLIVQPPDSPVPKNIKSSVSFRVIYPSRFPKGFKLRSDSFQASLNTVSYIIDSPEGEIVATQQERPSEEIQTQFPETLKLQVNVGEAVVSRFKDPLQTIIAVKNADSLLLLNTSTAPTDEQLRLILENLQFNP